MKYSIVFLFIFCMFSSCSVTHYLTPEQLGVLAESEIFIDAITVAGKKSVAVVVKNPDHKYWNGEYILSLEDWNGVTQMGRFDTNPGPIEYIYTLEPEELTEPICAILYQYERKQNKKFVRDRYSKTLLYSTGPP